jgi:16S rRNA processing protein RimM
MIATKKERHPEEPATRASRRTLGADPGPVRPPVTDPPPKRVCVGVIAGAHGVQGAVRIKSFTADPKDVARYGPVENEKGERRFRLRLAGSAKGVVIARLNGVTDRNQAEALRGLRLYLPRAALPPTEDEEYYHADLIGLEAALGDGTALGRVRAVHDFGAGDTLEIERPSGPPAMVPFTRAIVPMVDLAAGRLVVDPPPGLIDEPVQRRGRNPHPNPLPLAGEGTQLDPPPQTGEGMGGGKRRKSARRTKRPDVAVAEPEPAP